MTSITDVSFGLGPNDIISANISYYWFHRIENASIIYKPPQSRWTVSHLRAQALLDSRTDRLNMFCRQFKGLHQTEPGNRQNHKTAEGLRIKNRIISPYHHHHHPTGHSGHERHCTPILLLLKNVCVQVTEGYLLERAIATIPLKVANRNKNRKNLGKKEKTARLHCKYKRSTLLLSYITIKTYVGKKPIRT